MSAPYGQQGSYPAYPTAGYGYDNKVPPYSAQAMTQGGPYYDPNVDPGPNQNTTGGYQNSNAAPPPYLPPPVSALRAYAPDDVMEDNTELSSFSDKSIRRAFIRKVYLILTTQLLFTLTFVLLFTFCNPIKVFLKAYSWVYWIAYGVFLVVYIVLVCVKSARRKVPYNYICLAIFTAAFTYMTAAIAGYYEAQLVFIALGITVVVCVGITIFAIQTKIDFTLCSGLLFVITLVVILFSIAIGLTFAFAKLDQRQAAILQCVYGAVCALLFSMYLVFDTQMLMGDKSNAFSEEEYVYAALQLYLDIVQIFLAILQIVGGASR